VDIAPADEIRPNSAEGRFIDAGGRETPCAVLAGDLRGARRTRSQGASVETNVDQALDAVVCVPNGSMDVDGRPGISADESRSDPG
jgi:erythromycin esterase